MKRPEVSIIIAARNEEDFIEKCIKSILNQSFKNFELIIVDDYSIDKTSERIKDFKDTRLKYIKNNTNKGISKSRNRAIRLSKGNYIFITDADCFADKNWIKNGYNCFKKNPDALGVQGVTYYVSKNYEPTYSDRVVQSLVPGGRYITANIAYKKEILEKAGLFDERFVAGEDLAMGIQVSKFGKILFSKNMIIIHQKDLWTIKNKLNSAKRIGDRVLLYQYYGFKKDIYSRIILPFNFIICFIPPLVLFALLFKKYRTLNDFKLFLILYPYLLYERYNIWKKAIQEKIFLI